ncbi:MAG: flagellar protein FlgN [Nitrosospira sp.]|nr:flagellar protein FlgN [Nitrosospira sp.]
MSETVFDPIPSINAECNATYDFIDILRREQHALRQSDVSLLLPLAQEKARQTQQLAQLAAARKSWLGTLSPSPDRAGRNMERGLRNFPGAAEAWEELLEVAETASQLNKINGSLVGQRLRYTRQALSVLQAIPQDAGLYGPNGHSQAFSGGRELGEV